MNDEELKACPHCGGEASYSVGEKGDGSPYPYVECIDCGATAEPEMWNQRVVS